MIGIYKFHFSCRGGDLSGIFTAEQENVEIFDSIDVDIHFGEVLGKHSEVILNSEDITLQLITKDKKAIYNFETYNMETGYNPFDYYVYKDHNGEELDEESTLYELIEMIKVTKKEI